MKFMCVKKLDGKLSPQKEYEGDISLNAQNKVVILVYTDDGKWEPCDSQYFTPLMMAPSGSPF